MKKMDFSQSWSNFLHWKGWRTFAGFWAKAWHNTAGWKGWRILFGLPFPLLLLLSAGCGVGLVWVFVQRLEQQIPAYFLYALSAYCMSALCVRLPSALRAGKQWMTQHPKVA